MIGHATWEGREIQDGDHVFIEVGGLTLYHMGSANLIDDAISARDIDVLLADTAGRLQSQQGLMDELAKVKRVIARRDESAPHEVMLVVDASQGQNALVQAEKFNEALGLTGITVTKLDGSAKGGVMLAIANKLGVPVRFIGIGESAEDMQEFNAEDYADALLART